MRIDNDMYEIMGQKVAPFSYSSREIFRVIVSLMSLGKHRMNLIRRLELKEI